jgi:hypothetical protein
MKISIEEIKFDENTLLCTIPGRDYKLGINSIYNEKGECIGATTGCIPSEIDNLKCEINNIDTRLNIYYEDLVDYPDAENIKQRIEIYKSKRQKLVEQIKPLIISFIYHDIELGYWDLN